MKLVLSIIFSTIITLGFTQALEEEINVVGYKFLDYGSNMPENIRSSRSAVLVSVPSIRGERGDWMGLSKEFHKVFKESGIDAVAYYFVEDVMAGPQVSSSIAESFTEREIENLIFISRVDVEFGGKKSERYVTVVTPFNGKYDLMDHGQKAWKQQEKKLDKLLKKIEKEASKTGEKTNNLIVDSPEFFKDTPLITKNRFERYPSDLKIDKLAIPKFEIVEVPDKKPIGVVNNKVEEEIEKGNKQARRFNWQMNDIVKAYPFKYELVDYDVNNEKELWDQGFQFVLLKIHTSGEVAKRLLDYPEDEFGEDMVTVKPREDGSMTFRTIPATANIYKYYVKHLYTGDIYVGEAWDADEIWQDAIKNFITNLKKETGVR